MEMMQSCVKSREIKFRWNLHCRLQLADTASLTLQG